MSIVKIMPDSLQYNGMWESYGYVCFQVQGVTTDRKESSGVMLGTKEDADNYFKRYVANKYSKFIK